MNKQNKSSTITLENKVVAHRISDGSGLIPAEIKANTSFDNNLFSIHLSQEVTPLMMSESSIITQPKPICP